MIDFLSRRRYEYYSIKDTGLKDIRLPGNGQREKERIIVVDDLYLLDNAEDREKYYPVLSLLANRTDIWLILISRCPIPGWLKPLYIKQIFVIINGNELCFTEEDEDNYFEKWELSPMRESMKRIRELGNGHPLFSRIVAMQLQKLDKGIGSNTERLKVEYDAIELARRDFWDYLEIYVYDQWSMELQEFLMDISVVEEFDQQMARLITKKNDVGRIILLAQETGDFLIENSKNDAIIYELHIPMKLSMRRRLGRRCTQMHIDGLYYSAGSSYELMGAVPEALSMYEKCHNEESISRLLTLNARKYPGCGYYWELRRYYLALSKEVIQNSPELLAGMSMLHSILLNDEESERWYQVLVEYARTHTGREKKEAQARLLYLDITLPHRGTVQTAEIINNVGNLITDRKNFLPEMSLTNNQPSMMNGGKDFCEWSRRDKELAKSTGKIIELVLGRFGKGLVSIALAESYFEKGMDSYEVWYYV